MDDDEIEVLCDLCGRVAHSDDDHVTYCECGVQACGYCIVRVEDGTGDDHVCKECAAERPRDTDGTSVR